MRCPECGEENPEHARFCLACGSLLEPGTPERRKLATLLFCDMSGSTAMGERVDAESVREMMFAYFHEMRGAIERHGGTVEKFIGDAVMAVFGVPTAHEDDALRAVRAAWEMQERLQDLNDELERRYGSRIALRIGVNTGEVVAGDATLRQALVTGDAVNVAARLEQAASPGEVLIGEATFKLVRDAVSVEPVPPLSLKGKSEPLPAYRLTHVDAGAPARARRLDTPMVGRKDELIRLQSLLSQAASGRARLATVVGEAGVGKSRLAAELLSSARDEFQILSGRCLQYGEGITYWPIAEIVRQAAGIRDEHSRDEALARIGQLVPEPAGQVVAQAVGLAEGESGTEDIAAAVGELLESLARERPLLLFVDDIHWAAPALLELITGLPDRLDSAPTLLLCLARPDLLEDHPGWDVSVRLEPLERAESTALVAQLLGEAALPKGLSERVSAAAAGNPLFVEELVGMLIDEGLLERRNGSWATTEDLAAISIPPTLRELLGARLDRLPVEERSALERGSVEGQLFHRGAVVELSDGRIEDVPAHIGMLVAREFVRPAAASFADEAAFRVRHVLIRDAAYESIPKKLRANLHERFASWLEARVGERVTEVEEILGYHLEQAYRLREQLGPVAAADRELALRASDRLMAAGRRAFARRDASAAVNLLLRAAELRPPQDSTRLESMESAGHLLVDAGDIEHGAAVFARALDEATAAGNRPLAARVELFVGWTRLLLDPGHGAAAILEVGARLEPALQEATDDLSLARLHDMRAYVHDLRRRSADVEREAEIGISHARRAGSRWHELELHWWLFWELPAGPRPVEEAIERCHELRERLDGDQAAEAVFFESLGQLEAMRRSFDQARDFLATSIAIRETLGLHILTTKFALPALGMIELLAAEPAAAETVLRRAFDEAGRSGDRETESSAASLLMEALLAQDRLADAEALVPVAAQAAVGDAVVPHVRSLCARAAVLARQGRFAESETAAREAVQLTADTDDPALQAAALVRLAEIQADAGRPEDAREAAERAVDTYGRKGHLVGVAAARALLARIGSPGTIGG